MSVVAEIELMKAVTEAARKIDVLAFDTERYNPDLSDALREIYRQLEEAADRFVWGRPLRTDRVLLVGVPDRPLDELGER